MKEGTASHTARSVAAHRLDYARAGASYGDPAADEALTRDVAAGLRPEAGRMHEYLRGRTGFFDRVVTGALGRGVTQVVIGGAGYDGRALRYAAPGVHWFEVDHPDTQADKRERLARLGLDTRPVRFIAADFTADPVAGPLLEAGLDPAQDTLVLLEGVAVYLDRPVLARVLSEFRQAVPAGSTLAISVSVHAPDSATRRRFQQRVAAVGEQARSVLTGEQATAVLAAAGWEVGPPSGRQRSAGLLLARAVAAPAPPDRPAPPGRDRPAPVGPGRRLAGPGALGPPGPDPARLPLSALLSQALTAFTIEADNEAEHRLPHRTTSYGGTEGGGPWLTSLLMWANCLRHLPDEGITLAELRARARTGTNLDGMRRWGYVTFIPDPGRGQPPRPDALIRPTGWGRAARQTWPEATEAVESRWRGRLGPGPFDALRAALAGVARHLDPALPDCLPILGYGLATRPDRGRDSGVAGPAADRSTAGSGSELPLWALLSRPLLAFALQYEREPGPSLALSADILRVLTESGVPARDVPALGGVSRESVAAGTGAARRLGLLTEGRDHAGGRFRLVCLTGGGVQARDEYPARAARVEADWRTRFGGAPVTALRRALEPLAAGDPAPLLAGLDPYPGNWRARVKPLATLPHYPMTLHRGGYPDGS